MAVVSPTLVVALAIVAVARQQPRPATTGDSTDIHPHRTVTGRKPTTFTATRRPSQHLDDYHDCTTPVECSGRVTSDLGWSADIGIHGSEYVLSVTFPIGAVRRWRRAQRPSDYRFSQSTKEAGSISIRRILGSGQDFGIARLRINQALMITMPFRLEKVA